MDPQLPDELAAKKQEMDYQIRKENRGKQEQDQIKYEVREGMLLIDNIPR